MAGTKEGGAKARDKNIQKYGKNYYAKIGAVGGKLSDNGGFASTKVGKDGLTGQERAKKVGAKGGKASRKTDLRAFHGDGMSYELHD